MLIVRQRGGRFLRRVGKDGYDNVHGQFLYEAGDERAEKKTGQALREGLSMKNKKRALKGHVSSQGIVDGSDEMLVDRQETVTQLSSSVDDHPDRSSWAHQGRSRIHSFDDGDCSDDGDGFPPSLASNADFADFFDTPSTYLMSLAPPLRT